MGGVKFIIVYTTVASKEEAKKIARALLEKRYIACANLFPIDSIYWWQGKIEKAKEFGLFLKTPIKNYKKIEEELKMVHPYELPCIISFPIVRGERNYLKWIGEEVV